MVTARIESRIKQSTSPEKLFVVVLKDPDGSQMFQYILYWKILFLFSLSKKK